MNLTIRQETDKDINKVYNVVKEAFIYEKYSDHDEQNLVNRLRKSNAFVPELSIVAEMDEKIVGQILFTRIKIGNNISLALAPLSVLPVYQGKGIGGRLILRGHRVAKELGYTSVIILGHPSYYPRFGYRPASLWNIKAPFDVPDDSFMAIELLPNGLKNVSGIVEYAKEFFITVN